MEKIILTDFKPKYFMRANLDIRIALSKTSMKQYQLAELLGVSEGRLSTMLRNELPESEQRKIIDLINSEAKKKDEAI